ncbi:protease Do [Kocuria tytonicola]|uniref:S1C family serine protease n=1 Tax=Kocuria tytonicola TaxID=2055946 RepID=UPI000EF8CD8B|nr:trypsin-like peptidase domain-containing protein [Kocuria tytonicola]RLZ03129.1 protease Do [Kocuria tytonicola]
MADSRDPRTGGDPQHPVPGGHGSAADGTGADSVGGSSWQARDTRPMPPAGHGTAGYDAAGSAREGARFDQGQAAGRDPYYGVQGGGADQGGYGATPYEGTGSFTGAGHGYGVAGDGGAQPPYSGGPGYEGHPEGSYPQEDGTAAAPKRRFGAGTMIAGMALAGLLGAGVAVGTGAVGADGGASGGTNSSPVIVNDTDSVNEITGATQKASPSVVTISATAGSQAGTGSGVILDDQGHILTNTHVVTLDGATSDAKLEVQTADGSVRKATVVGTDPESDLAVITVDPSGLTPAEFGDSGKLNVGDAAIAIGAPLGLSGTVTDGIVSTLNRTIAVASSAAQDTPEDTQRSPGGPQDFFFNFPDNGQSGSQSAKSSVYLNVLQTDAAINPGNSGGALVNAQGQVIGINVAIASAGGSSGESSASGNIGVGFSIPANTAKRVADEIIKDGKASHGYLGASVSGYTPSGANSETFSAGAKVRSVESGSPAEDAGLKANDVVTKFNGKPITDADALTAGVRELGAGSKAEITYQRDGDERTATVTVGNAADHKK